MIYQPALQNGRFNGVVALSELPPHRGCIISIAFFAVATPDAAIPFDGYPPASAVTNCHEILKQVHVELESFEPKIEQPFSIEQMIGFYFLQVRVLLFRSSGDSMQVQSEKFFFGKRPVEISLADCTGHITLPISWPAIPLDELHHYGTVSPKANS